MLFFFVSFRCRSPSQASDWAVVYSTETVHAQPVKSGRLRPEHHQCSRLCLRVLVLRDGCQILITCIIASRVNTVHIGFVISMRRSVWRFLTLCLITFDIFWDERLRAASDASVTLCFDDRLSLKCTCVHLAWQSKIWENFVIKISWRNETSRTFDCFFLLKVHAFRKVIKGYDDSTIFFSWHYKPLFCNIHFLFLTVYIGWCIFSME